MLSRKVIIGKNKFLKGGLKIQIETTTDNQEVVFPAYNIVGETLYFDYTIYWGDGTSTYRDSSHAPTKTYTTAGTYTIEIKGICDAIGIITVTAAYRAKWSNVVKKVISWGGNEFAGLRFCDNIFNSCINLTELPVNHSIKVKAGQSLGCWYMFAGCTSLTSIPEILIRNSNIYLISFAGCTGLTSIPANAFKNTTLTYPFAMFAYCTGLTTVPDNCFENCQITNFASLFLGCANLESIGNNVFLGNTSVLSLNAMFYGCTKLQITSDIFDDFDFLNKNIDFRNCFDRASFTGVQGTAPELWNIDFGTGTPITTDCFNGAGNSLTSLTNYNDIPVAWK